jgi:hypothetical protein
MNFIEAVKEMQKCKKVRMSNWRKEIYMQFKYGNLQLYTENENHPAIIGLDYIEATDWEIVDDDKDWNLTKHIWFFQDICDNCGENHLGRKAETVVDLKNVKKCRDLILEDIELRGLCCPFAVREVINEIINKRFGD